MPRCLNNKCLITIKIAVLKQLLHAAFIMGPNPRVAGWTVGVQVLASARMQCTIYISLYTTRYMTRCLDPRTQNFGRD